ncbi:dipeptide epimerase [bacterium]|nr:dipeptide epimerase [bacterium]
MVKLEIRHIRLALKKKIKHASHERNDSENVVTVVHLDNGSTGLGEGVPRPYVTGETVDSALEALQSWPLASIVGDPVDFAGVVRALDAWMPQASPDDPRAIGSNAARCSAEIAILDAYARHFGVPIGDALNFSAVAADVPIGEPVPVRYSGAITAENPWKERISATKMRIWGFRQVKVKVGIPGADEVARLRRIRRRLGSKCDIRLDANEAWTPAEFRAWSERLAFSQPSAYEQPVPHEAIDELGKPEFRQPFPVILDESLCGPIDAETAIQGGFGEIFNIRLSKCGGVLPSLRLIATAIRNGRRYGLGCHPGESPILSAAGRAVATRVRDLVFLEGSYDRHVLAEPFAKQDITFGYGGKANPLGGSGLGIEIDMAKLDSVTVRRKDITYA